MKSKIMKRKVLVIFTALALTLSSAAVAFAADDQTQSNTPAKGDKAIELNLTDVQKEAVNQAREESMKEALAQLVSAGTITQDESDQMTANTGKVMRAPDKNAKTSGGGIFTSLTSDQRKALDAEIQTVMKEELASLVSAGTITQDQADQFTTTGKPERSGKSTIGFDLTDAQKTALREAREDSMKKAIENLVSAGTLSQSTADQLNSFTANKVKPSVEHKSVLTSDQMKALQSAFKTSFENKLASLVSAGTITQTQSDFFAKCGGFRGPFGFGHQGHGGAGVKHSSTETTTSL